MPILLFADADFADSHTVSADSHFDSAASDTDAAASYTDAAASDTDAAAYIITFLQLIITILQLLPAIQLHMVPIHILQSLCFFCCSMWSMLPSIYYVLLESVDSMVFLSYSHC